MDIGVKALGTVSKRGERKGGGESDVPVTFGGATSCRGAMSWPTRTGSSCCRRA